MLGSAEGLRLWNLIAARRNAAALARFCFGFERKKMIEMKMTMVEDLGALDGPRFLCRGRILYMVGCCLVRVVIVAG